MGVGLLLIRSVVLGNEATENRSAQQLKFWTKINNYFEKNCIYNRGNEYTGGIPLWNGGK
nr:MAG TPA: hypothetical protein [Caudoviricetes sp.]